MEHIDHKLFRDLSAQPSVSRCHRERPAVIQTDRSIIIDHSRVKRNKSRHGAPVRVSDVSEIFVFSCRGITHRHRDRSVESVLPGLPRQAVIQIISSVIPPHDIRSVHLASVCADMRILFCSVYRPLTSPVCQIRDRRRVDRIIQFAVCCSSLSVMRTENVYPVAEYMGFSVRDIFI